MLPSIRRCFKVVDCFASIPACSFGAQFFSNRPVGVCGSFAKYGLGWQYLVGKQLFYMCIIYSIENASKLRGNNASRYPRAQQNGHNNSNKSEERMRIF